MGPQITIPFVALIWLAAVLRLRSHLRGEGGSPRLTRILFLVAITVTLKIDVVGDTVDAVAGDTGARVLVRDIVAIWMASQAVVEVYEITRRANGRYAPSEVDRRVQALGRLLSGLVVVVALAMLVAWTEVPAGKPGVLDIGRATTDPAALVFWTSYSLTWAGFSLTVAWITLRWWASGYARRAVLKSPVKAVTRTCMLLFGLAGIFAAIYVLAKLAIIVLLLLGVPEHTLAPYVVPPQAIPQAISLALIFVASTLTFPLWTFRRLANPWRFVVEDSQDLVLDHRVFASPKARLHRRCLEIHEASARVARFVPSHLEPAIIEAVADVSRDQQPYLRDAVIVGLGMHLEHEGHPQALYPVTLGHCTARQAGDHIKTETEWAYDLLAVWALRGEALERVNQSIPLPEKEKS